MLGFAAVMMLAASFGSLIFPSIEAALNISDNQLIAACIVVAISISIGPCGLVYTCKALQ